MAGLGKSLTSVLSPGPPTVAEHNCFLWVTPNLSHLQVSVFDSRGSAFDRRIAPSPNN